MKGFGDLDRSFFAARLHGVEDKPFNGASYKQVTHEVDFATDQNTLWASLGSHKERERLFLDQNSEFVSTITEKIANFYQGKVVLPVPRTFELEDTKFVYIQDVLEHVNNVIDGLTAPIGSNRDLTEQILDLRLEQFLKKQEKNPEGFIDVTLDNLAKESILVCRHKGLLAASILGSLVKSGILPSGYVHQYRSTLYDNFGNKIGAHTWAVYRVSGEDDIWLCDPRWLTAEKTNSPVIKKKYGERVIDKMIEKLNRADKHIPEELTRGMIFDFSPKEPALIFSEPPVVAVDEKSENSLVVSAKRGDIERVVFLCKNKAALNVKRTAQDSTGKTALHYLAEKKDSGPGILALLDAASWTTDPTTIQDNNGNTPLHIFARVGNYDALKLIDRRFTAAGWVYGATSGLYKMLNKASFYQNHDGLTPIMVALTEQPDNAQLISNLLIAMGATGSDINVYKQLNTAFSTHDNTLYEKIKSEHPSLIGWHWDVPLAKPDNQVEGKKCRAR